MSMARGDARFVGRIGALAVALGIGAAVVNSPGLALADTDGADSSSASSGSASSDGADSAKGPASDASDATGGPADATGTTSATASSTEQPKRKKSRGDEQVTVDATATPTTSRSRTDDQPARRSMPTQEAEVATTSSAAPAVEREVQPTAPSAARVSPVAVAPTVTVDEPAAAPPADAPTAPAQAPALWAMLGWVRREIGHVPAPAIASSAPTVTSTSLVAPSAAITATSPLGTQQQLEAERRAAETANTLPVALMKLVLRFGFLSSAQRQFAQVGGPDQANLDRLDAAVDEYAMGAAFQQQILNSNAPTVVMQVAPPHTWYGQTVPGSRILYDNPDTIYRFMGVNAASTYVIRGQFTGDRPADTTFSVLTGLSGNTAAVLSGRDLVVNPDGSFVVTASRAPAAPGQTNHLQLTNESTLIATRNTLSAWGTEVPMTLAVERVDGPPNSLFSQLGGFAIPVLGPVVVGNPLLTALVSLIPPLPDPPPLLRGTFAAVIMALGIQRESTYMAVATTDPATGQPIAPNVLKNPTRNAEFLATQLQSAGYFQLTDQQALVVTIDPGNARYFVLPVTNDWTISKDYWNQQTSLNDSQAIANPDGTYTIVISRSDPHVANWVSTGGLNQGTISMRFQDLDPASTELPTVSSQVVTLDQLAAVLPATTVYYTEAQRAAQLAARKVGFDSRFAPYPQ